MIWLRRHSENGRKTFTLMEINHKSQRRCYLPLGVRGIGQCRGLPQILLQCQNRNRHEWYQVTYLWAGLEELLISSCHSDWFYIIYQFIFSLLTYAEDCIGKWFSSITKLFTCLSTSYSAIRILYLFLPYPSPRDLCKQVGNRKKPHWFINQTCSTKAAHQPREISA